MITILDNVKSVIGINDECSLITEEDGVILTGK